MRAGGQLELQRRDDRAGVDLPGDRSVARGHGLHVGCRNVCNCGRGRRASAASGRVEAGTGDGAGVAPDVLVAIEPK